MPDVMGDFRSVLDRPDNPWVQRHREEGGKVCGYWCTYVPEELLAAAGMLPVRVRGRGCEDCNSGDAWLHSRLCTFTRWSLSVALEGMYDFLDGLVGLNSCDQVRRASQVWMSQVPTAFSHFLAVPRVSREINFQAYLREVRGLKEHLEEHLGLALTDDSLREAVAATNRKRALLGRLADLRKPGENGSLSGSEMLTVSVAATQLPVSVFNALARALLDERRGAERTGDEDAARIVVCGGELDEPDFLRLIEGQGARVVGEFLCFGERFYRQPVAVEGDPLVNIARRYFDHVPCVCMAERFRDRFGALRRLLRDVRADGVVFQRLKFCQLWGSELHNMQHFCREEDIPILSLEREYQVISTGQTKTRIQAFLEQIEARKQA